MQVSNRVGPGMSEQRCCRIRLEISRETHLMPTSPRCQPEAVEELSDGGRPRPVLEPPPGDGGRDDRGRNKRGARGGGPSRAPFVTGWPGWRVALHVGQINTAADRPACSFAAPIGLGLSRKD